MISSPLPAEEISKLFRAIFVIAIVLKNLLVNITDVVKAELAHIVV